MLLMISIRSSLSKFALLRPSFVTFCKIRQVRQRALYATSITTHPRGIPLNKSVTAKKSSRAGDASRSSKLETEDAGRRDGETSPEALDTTLPKVANIHVNQQHTMKPGPATGLTKRRVGRPRKIHTCNTTESKDRKVEGAEYGKQKLGRPKKAATSRRGESKSTRKQMLSKSSLEQDSTGTNVDRVEDGNTAKSTAKSKEGSGKRRKLKSSTEAQGKGVGMLDDCWTPKSGPLIEPLLIGSPDTDRISKHIYQEYYESKRDGEKLDTKRIHVVSKELCDDVLERLKPSLEKHVGCDIIDLNPGVGVWSSAIHDFLQPRTHILMEPEESVYRTLLQPLLDDRDSKYKLVPKSGIVWGHLQDILTPEFLPHQKELEKGDPLLQQPNNTLLFIANLGYYPKRFYRSFPSIATLVVHQLLTAARAHSLFHKYGLVRMLIWVPEDEKTVMFPRNISGRRKATIQAEITCSEISEIASSTYVANFGHREHTIELDSSRAALKRMKEAGIKTPESRLRPLQTEGSINDRPVLDMAIKWNYLPELEDLEKRYAAGNFEMYRDDPEVTAVLNRRHLLRKDLMTPEWIRYSALTRTEKSNKKLGRSWGIGSAAELDSLRKRLAAGEFTKYTVPESEVPDFKFRGGKWGHTREYKRLYLLRHRRRAHLAKANLYEPILQEYEKIIEKQKEALSANDCDSAILWDQVKTRNEALKENIAQFHEENMKALQAQLDNRRAFYQDPPLLQWDRRNFEPLKVKATEFFPRHEMALIDFHPKALWPILRENFPENYDMFEYIVTYLILVPKQSVREGLLGLYPGAYDWIEPRCPSLKDPNKGGNADLDLLSVRCITEDMFREITEAWMSWPFRPPRNELIRRLGTGLHGADEEVSSSGPPEDD